MKQNEIENIKKCMNKYSTLIENINPDISAKHKMDIIKVILEVDFSK